MSPGPSAPSLGGPGRSHWRTPRWDSCQFHLHEHLPPPGCHQPLRPLRVPPQTRCEINSWNEQPGARCSPTGRTRAVQSPALLNNKSTEQKATLILFRH